MDKNTDPQKNPQVSSQISIKFLLYKIWPVNRDLSMVNRDSILRNTCHVIEHVVI